MSEEELVRRARQGDAAAFEQLVLANQNRVYSLALRLTGDREEASDLAQEAFLRAWQGLPEFREECGFATWIYRLTTNLCIDYIRRSSRRREVMPTTSLDDENAGFPEPADWTQDPQVHLERAEMGRALKEGIASLPDYYRAPLVLRELCGFCYQEISDTLGVDMGTIKSRLARARAQLVKFLLADGNISPPGTSKSGKKKAESRTKGRTKGRKGGGQDENM